MLWPHVFRIAEIQSTLLGFQEAPCSSAQGRVKQSPPQSSVREHLSLKEVFTYKSFYL